MELNDMLGLGKVLPLDKLADMLSNSCGRIFKSYFDRRDINTKVYEIDKVSEAEARKIKTLGTAIKENSPSTGRIEYKKEQILISSQQDKLYQRGDYPIALSERVQERLNFQNERKQVNIEQVAAIAAEELKDQEPVTDEPVNTDWATRFFRIVEDISNEEMQELWGKILAREIKQPKTFSVRTLELLKDLSKLEADTFMKIANFAVEVGNCNYLFKTDDLSFMKDKHNITYFEIALLVEIGLIQPGEMISYQLLQNTENTQIFFVAGSKIMIATKKANTPTVNMPVHVFTKAGNELLRLVKLSVQLECLAEIANSIKSESISVGHASVLSRDLLGNVVYTLPIAAF